MSKIYVANHVTLDGVMQSPGRPDEDSRGGFTQGGWATAGSTSDVVAALQGRVVEAGGMRLLLGHRSYSEMLSHWNEAGGPFKEGLNAAPKYVASRSEATMLPWPNSTLLAGDVPAKIRALKAANGPDLCVMGSGQLIQTLLRHDLLDEFLLFIHPLVLGRGTRVFPEGCAPATLELVDHSTFRNGVCVARYAVLRAQ